MAVPRSLRNAFISALVLLILLVVAGVLYTLLAYNGDAKVKPAAKSAAATREPVVKPRKPSPKAKEGVAVELITSPVNAGSNASLNARTNAGSKCSILVTYAGAKSTDSGLNDKKTDDFGSVSWSWTVSSGVPAGTWPVKVTCTYHGRTGVVQTDLKVLPPGTKNPGADPSVTN
jgi:hypothetical protein